jgi:formate hydrogenlyase subunit 6/NADH:ubiquinone oxidoreductase subunit I
MEIIEKPIFRADYEMELVDNDWLKGAVKPKRFIDFIPEQCILCEGCVDICPWYCIFMVSPDAVEESGNVQLAGQMASEDILFLIDDNACTRCNLCVERCPTGALVQSEVTGGKKRGAGATGKSGGAATGKSGGRAMGKVPSSQKA